MFWTPTFTNITFKMSTRLTHQTEFKTKLNRLKEDYRVCELCRGMGDGVTSREGRLLSYEVDGWVHLNCAKWSTSVTLRLSKSSNTLRLESFDKVLLDTRNQVCKLCNQLGATIQCARARCTKIFHFNCALKSKSVFFHDNTMLCLEHTPKAVHEHIENKASVQGYQNELFDSMIVTDFSFYQTCYIERDVNKEISSVLSNGKMEIDREDYTQKYCIRAGNIVIDELGMLADEDFCDDFAVYPIGLKIRKIMKNTLNQDSSSIYRPRKIHEFHIKSRNNILLDKKQNFGSIHEFSSFFLGENQKTIQLPEFLGFGHGTYSSLLEIFESLPRVERTIYNSLFGKNTRYDLKLASNPSGCSRTECWRKKLVKQNPRNRQTSGQQRTGTGGSGQSKNQQQQESLSSLMKEHAYRVVLRKWPKMAENYRKWLKMT